MTLDFRKQNPLDVSLPTVSPSFGAQTAKAQGRFAEIVQEGSRQMIQANAELDSKQFNYEAQREYTLLATQKKAELLDASTGGKMKDGRQANEHFDEWSQQWLKERNKGAPNDLANRTLSQSIGNLSAQTRANMIPKEIAKKKEHNRQNQLNITETAANEVLNMSPDSAFEETDNLIDLQTLSMEELAGDVFSAEEAATYTKQYGNKLAVSALDNFLNNDRPDLIIKSLGPELHTEEGKAWLKQNGVDPESLPKTDGNNAINMNVSPAQKSNYLKKAIKMMQAQDVKDNGLLQRRVNNFMTSQKVGKIDENQSLEEFKAIENDLFALDRFGKPKYKAGFITDTLLKMTGANVQRRAVQKLHTTPNGKLSSSAQEIDTSVNQHLDELKERYKDNPEVLGYLNSPTIKDSMAAEARRQYFVKAKEVYDSRMKDSSSYLSQNDEEVMKLTNQVVQEMGATGAINPATMSQYLDTLGRKADELGIPKMAQSMLPEEIFKSIAQVGNEIKAKDGTGDKLAAYMETIKNGVPPEKWQDFKDVLKDDHDFKETDFHAVDSFNAKEAAYWQRLNSPVVDEAIKNQTKGTELTETKVRKILTDEGKLFGLWGKGILAKDSNLSKALIGPGGKIRNIKMHDRMMGMAVKSYQYEVLFNGKDEDEAMEIVENKLNTAYPTVKGKHGTVIVPATVDEHGREQVKNFLEHNHKVSDFDHNMSKYPNIMQQMTNMGLTTLEQQNKYLDDNYKIQFGTTSEGRISGYLVNKGDGTTIPFDITGDDGKVQPLEFDVTDSKSLESHTAKLKKINSLRDPAGLGQIRTSAPPTIRTFSKGDVPKAVESIKSSVGSTLDRLATLVTDPVLTESVHGPSTLGSKERLAEYDEATDTESKKKMLGITKENLHKVEQDILALPENNQLKKLYTQFTTTGIELDRDSQYQLRSLVLHKIGQLKGNIPESLKENITEGFKLSAVKREDGKYDYKIYHPDLVPGEKLGSVPFDYQGKPEDRRYSFSQYYPSNLSSEDSELYNMILGVESKWGRDRFDSTDNKSQGIAHWALHEELYKTKGMKEYFLKNYPQYKGMADGIDRDVLSYNDKLNVALMDSYFQSYIKPRVKGAFGEDEWDKFSSLEKEKLYYSAYNGGVPKDKNRKDILLKRLKSDHWKQTMENVEKYSKLGRKGRSPQSLEIETPDAKTVETTEGAQPIVDETMENINANLEKIMEDINKEVFE